MPIHKLSLFMEAVDVFTSQLRAEKISLFYPFGIKAHMCLADLNITLVTSDFAGNLNGHVLFNREDLLGALKQIVTSFLKDPEVVKLPPKSESEVAFVLEITKQTLPSKNAKITPVLLEKTSIFFFEKKIIYFFYIIIKIC